jgi:hypothetical protein
MLRGDWAAAKRGSWQKKKKIKHTKKNSPVAMLGVGAINKWRETYLTPIR